MLFTFHRTLLYYILVLLLILHAVKLVHSQGAGGGGGGGGGGSFGGGGSGGGSYYSNYGSGSDGSSSCTTEECRRSGIIVGSTIGGIFGFVLLFIIGWYFRSRLCSFCHCNCLKGRAFCSNKIFIKFSLCRCTKTTAVTTNIFPPGSYSMRYHQYSNWHGPHYVQLEFNNETVTGSGTDDVGSFTVNGIYSEKTARLGFIKQYELGTGNRRENFGHQVKIQVAWNDREQSFNGKWYVKTAKYSGEDKFELKLQQGTERV